jgi:hypothetical protein
MRSLDMRQLTPDNGGEEWQPSKDPQRVNVHDFADRALGGSPRPSPLACMT